METGLFGSLMSCEIVGMATTVMCGCGKGVAWVWLTRYGHFAHVVKMFSKYHSIFGSSQLLNFNQLNTVCYEE